LIPTHIRSFNAVSEYTTLFPEGLTISGGKTVDVPLGRMDDRGNLVIDDKSPVSINGKPANNIKRSTTRKYLFTDRLLFAVLVSSEYSHRRLSVLLLPAAVVLGPLLSSCPTINNSSLALVFSS
jgi:hypothetical protein